VIFFFTINASANLSNLTLVSFTDGAGTIGLQGLGFTAACLLVKSGAFSTGAGAASAASGASSAASNIAARIFVSLLIR
jgi:hypothetical protein